MLNSKNKDTLVVTFSHLQERFRRFALRILPNEEDAEDAEDAGDASTEEDASSSKNIRKDKGDMTYE